VELIEHLADCLAPLGRVHWRRFFGGHGLCVGAVQFAFVIDGVVYLRADQRLARELEARGGEAFSYDTKRRTVRVASYWSVPEAELDDEDVFVGWSRRALAAARAAKR
jgi:DNA transformation protein